MNESQLGEVMNEAWYMLPLLCMVVEDGYGRSCGLSWLIGGLIVSKLELEPPKSESSPRKVVRDALFKPSFLGFRYGERCRFSFLVGPIVSITPVFWSSY